MSKLFGRWFGCLVAGSAALGCSQTPNTDGAPQPVQDRVALTQFQGVNACVDLEKYLEDSAVKMMRTQLEGARDGVPSWGWWGSVGGRGGEIAFAAGGDAAAPQSSAAKAAPDAYTTTNTQVKGVDEADFVKNDGTRIFALSANKLYAAKSWPANELAISGKLEIEGWPREMFLDEKNRVVVLSTVYQPSPFYTAKYGTIAPCAGLYCGYGYSNAVKVTVVDVANLSSLKVLTEYYLPGSYTNSRRIGASVRVVLNEDFLYPAGVRFYPTPVECGYAADGSYDYNKYNSQACSAFWTDKARQYNEYNKLIAANETLIRGMTLDDWLRKSKVKVNGSEMTLPVDCSSYAKVSAPTRMGFLTVATVNLDAATLKSYSLLAESGEVYASAKNLYVATRHWWWWPVVGQNDSTYVHKFDITDPVQALYVASGTANGHIVDQFSMDENAAGYFRLATTTTKRVADTQNPQNTWGRLETSNIVQVLQEKQGALSVIGTSAEVAKGERIFSSRFVEDKAFVVTFRQTDPLFTFDMKDPTKPTQVGELKVPGFSTYIHPVDDSTLLTIGEFRVDCAPGMCPNNVWQQRRVQLSLFDVSDMTAPKQTFTQTVGNANGSSEAQYDHKAFNYFPEKKLLAIPFFDWYWGSGGGWSWSAFVSDLRVYSVDPKTGFVPKGSLSFNDLYQASNYYSWSYYWTPNVRRSVMADDFVYAISDVGIRSANIASLGTPLATAKFDRYVDANSGGGGGTEPMK